MGFSKAGRRSEKGQRSPNALLDFTCEAWPVNEFVWDVGSRDFRHQKGLVKHREGLTRSHHVLLHSHVPNRFFFIEEYSQHKKESRSHNFTSDLT
jgi:hypothetical protein